MELEPYRHQNSKPIPQAKMGLPPPLLSSFRRKDRRKMHILEGKLAATLTAA